MTISTVTDIINNIPVELKLHILRSLRLPKGYVEQTFGQQFGDVFGYTITDTLQLRSLVNNASTDLLQYLHQKNNTIIFDPVLESLLVTEMINKHSHLMTVSSCNKYKHYIIEQDNVELFKLITSTNLADITSKVDIIKDSKIYDYVMKHQNNYIYSGYSRSIILFPVIFKKYIKVERHPYPSFIVNDIITLKKFHWLDDLKINVSDIPIIHKWSTSLTIIKELFKRGNNDLERLIQSQHKYTPEVLNWIDSHKIHWRSVSIVIQPTHELKTLLWFYNKGVNIDFSYYLINISQWAKYYELAPVNDLSNEFRYKLTHTPGSNNHEDVKHILQFMTDKNINFGSNSFDEFYEQYKDYLSVDLLLIVLQHYKQPINILEQKVNNVIHTNLFTHISIKIKNAYPKLWGTTLALI